MTRRLALIGVAAVALASTAAIQAQPARPATAQERPRFEQAQRGPGFGQGQGMGQRQGMGQGQRQGMGQGQRQGQGQGFRRGGGPGQPGRPGGALRGLNLTDEQKAQVKAIHEKTKADVDAVLTPEQREALKTRRDGRGGGRGGGR
jgi:Spy/CpxP family protein refolding chaperone